MSINLCGGGIIKTKKIKRVLSAIIVILMIFSIIPIRAYASEGNKNIPIDSLLDYDEIYGGARGTKESSVSKDLSKAREIKNIAVFIEFSDQAAITIDDDATQARAEEVFNIGGKNTVAGGREVELISLKQYLNSFSYGNLDVTTIKYPKGSNSKVVSYKPSQPRTYFMRKSDKAPDGYSNNDEKQKREQELIEGALAAIKSQIEADYKGKENLLDANNDGIIDAISFYVEGLYGGYEGINPSDILWPHKTSNFIFNTDIAGKLVNSYNIVPVGDPKRPAGVFSSSRTSYGVVIHEFLHILGLPDLYRSPQVNGQEPVGEWSMLAINGSLFPNSLTAFYQREVLNWGSKLETIGGGTHTVTLESPKYKDPNEKRAVKIQSPLNSDEYFIVEYRKKDGFDSEIKMDNGGVIVYRINTKVSWWEGNSKGSTDLMYVFRPNETGLGNGGGDLTKATFSLESGRTSFGKTLSSSSTGFDNNSIHYSNGKNSGIVISNVSSGNNDTITFNVEVPSAVGSGTSSDPYIIDDPSDFDLVRGQSKAHFKMTKDIDMSLVNNFVSLGEFQGSFDGRGHKIKNLTIKEDSTVNTAAIFESIHDKAVVKNLVIENINSVNTSGSAAALAGNVYGTVENVKVESGNIDGSSGNAISTFKVGGLVAYTLDTAKISNSYSKANVTGTGAVGGFIGMNSNATIENCYSTGLVKGKNSNDSLGGFIGKNLLTGSGFGKPINYKKPINSYFNIKSSNKTEGIGNVEILMGSLSSGTGKEGVVGIEIDSSVQIDMASNKSKQINLKTSPSTSLNGTWESMDESIATVKDGIVTGQGKGTTKVLYKLPVGTNNMIFETKVEVKGNPVVAVTSVSLNKTEESLLKGSTTTLVATINPSNATNKEVTWSSSNTNVAKVDQNGKVTAVSKGTAIITVTTKDGAKKATCTITVTEPVTNTGIQGERIYGSDRYETSYKLFEKGWKASDTVVLASGLDYPDALAAAPLAGKKNAPILLVKNSSLKSQGRLKQLLINKSVKNVIIVGGTGIISPGIDKELKAMGITVKRLGGKDRYETSILIAKEVGINSGEVVLVNGYSFADPLSISSIANKKNMPILLTRTDVIPESIKKYLDTNSKNISKTYVVGSTGVVSNNVLSKLKNPERLGGIDRFKTNKSVLDRFKGELDLSSVYIASGLTFPDALSASALAGKNNNFVLLSHTTIVDDVVKSEISENKSKISKAYVLGSKAIISDEIIKGLGVTSIK